MKIKSLLRFVCLCALVAPAACKNNDDISSFKESAPAPTAGAPMGGSGPMSGGAPMMGGGGAAPSGAMPPGMNGNVPPPPSSLQKDISWKVPKGWTELTPSAMRAGSFSADGKDGQKADISVVVLAGIAGTDLENVNRWRGQLNLDPIDQASLSKTLESIAPGGRKMKLLDIVTNDLAIDGKYKKRMLAAIYPRGESTWFFKATGEDALIKSLKPSFVNFLENIKFRSGK
jgi:hypothetical protein